MLNKNQSKKWNSWKYVLILPALIAFVFLFQIETIAQEKKSEQITAESSKKNEVSVDVYKINKNTTDDELKEKTKALKENYAIKAVFSNIKRNSKNEITSISVNLKKGDEKTQEMEIKGTEAIKTFGIIISKNENGILTIDFAEDDIQLNKKSVLISPNAPLSADKEIFINGAKVTQKDLDELNPNEIERMDVNKNQNQQEIRIITKDHSKILNENDIYIDGEKVDPSELSRIDQNTIDRMDVNKNEKTIRIITKHSNSIINGSDLPMPPTPPTPPVFKFKSPKPPVFPKAPTAPKGDPINGDKKAWKEFKAKMEAFDAKMKKLEPQMEAFDKQMEEFDKQMEPFNKEMEIFEKKMKVYEQQMQEYQSKLNKKK